MIFLKVVASNWNVLSYFVFYVGDKFLYYKTTPFQLRASTLGGFLRLSLCFLLKRMEKIVTRNSTSEWCRVIFFHWNFIRLSPELLLERKKAHFSINLRNYNFSLFMERESSWFRPNVWIFTPFDLFTYLNNVALGILKSFVATYVVILSSDHFSHSP